MYAINKQYYNSESTYTTRSHIHVEFGSNFGIPETYKYTIWQNKPEGAHPLASVPI